MFFLIILDIEFELVRIKQVQSPLDISQANSSAVLFSGLRRVYWFAVGYPEKQFIVQNLHGDVYKSITDLVIKSMFKTVFKKGDKNQWSDSLIDNFPLDFKLNIRVSGLAQRFHGKVIANVIDFLL